MSASEILGEARSHMDKTVKALAHEFTTVRTGRASGAVLDSIQIDYYGTPTPITQLAGIKTPEAQLLVIEPWDKSVLSAIEKAIQSSDLGITPSNDGSVIRLPFPQLNEERRKELVKQCRHYAEESRVAVRNIRRDANAKLDRHREGGGAFRGRARRRQGRGPEADRRPRPRDRRGTQAQRSGDHGGLT